MFGKASRKWLIGLFPLLLPVALLVAFGGSAAAGSSQKAVRIMAPTARTATSTSLGTYSPTFVGPAATGCPSGCQLLTGPYPTPAVSASSGAAKTALGAQDRARALPFLLPHRPAVRKAASSSVIPTVSCVPQGFGCDTIFSSPGGAVGVKGINAVDSATHTPNIFKDVEPPDQGLCAGGNYAVETNNIGELKIFNASNLSAASPVISLDTIMGLGNRGWSSAGDPSCLYDPSNGGHWFITEFVSASPEQTGGPFAGCFAAVANTCYEGIAVTTGNSPFGPYNVYFLNANYNPNEPGAGFELNDYAKIASTQDAFLLFYDEFPLRGNGFGGGFFNGAQQFAFNKNAFENGEPVYQSNGSPNPKFTVAIENMGTLPTPDGTCPSDNTYHQPSITCWFSVIPAAAPDAADWDNSHGGSGFMMDTLDFYGNGDNRLAVWDWTGLSNLNSPSCSTCGGIQFSGQLFKGVARYFDPGNSPSGLQASQKFGPIPLGDQCGAAGLSYGNPPPAHCPLGTIATNSDQVTQVSQAGGQLYAGINTQIIQFFANNPFGPSTELHMGSAFFVVGTSPFDSTGQLGLTGEGYVSPAHEDLTFPAMAGEGSASNGGNGKALMSFTLTGNGGPFNFDGGGFYPSSAYARFSKPTGTPSVIHVADMGQSPQDGFTEYAGYPNQPPPNQLRTRWGDYGAAVFLPNSGGRIYFASEYIQYPNCTGKAFDFNAIGTCGGTRDGQANWGTSVNYIVP